MFLAGFSEKDVNVAEKHFVDINTYTFSMIIERPSSNLSMASKQQKHLYGAQMSQKQRTKARKYGGLV